MQRSKEECLCDPDLPSAPWSEVAIAFGEIRKQVTDSEIEVGRRSAIQILHHVSCDVAEVFQYARSQGVRSGTQGYEVGAEEPQIEAGSAKFSLSRNLQWCESFVRPQLSVPRVPPSSATARKTHLPFTLILKLTAS